MQYKNFYLIAYALAPIMRGWQKNNWHIIVLERKYFRSCKSFIENHILYVYIK